ncbi:unnamed protein product [Meloidogyne enterolobii]|uniref:Uncharacterized protein n=1 Tax=Meloidogyne enterolobii TaxID=390850 RepID=A0ACB0YZ76_MELEN
MALVQFKIPIAPLIILCTSVSFTHLGIVIIDNKSWILPVSYLHEQGTLSSYLNKGFTNL